MSDGLRHLIFVYNADSGVLAALRDVAKKIAGREDCSLCEITHGPLGKRAEWKACEARLGLVVEELHRDELPDGWRIDRTQLPCVLLRRGSSEPIVLVSRDEIAACARNIDRLEQRIVAALAGLDPGYPADGSAG